MFQNGGYNRKSTLLDLKDDVDIVLKFIEFIFTCKMYPNFSFFVLRLHEKPQYVHSFQEFLKIFCYYYVDIIVIAGICQNLFYDH